MKKLKFTLSLNKWLVSKSDSRKIIFFLAIALTSISILAFTYFHHTGEGVAYNDARSHLDIGRRVVEGLKPGLAQLGSVWLPLPHLLMSPTIWIDFFWHSGLSGAIQSMVSFVVTGLLVFFYLKELDVGLFGRIFAVSVFALNLNIIYLQSTAMTELLLLATMTAGAYYFMLWHKNEKILDLIKSGFWIMLSTLIRYDGWFLLFFSGLILALTTYKNKGYEKTEGLLILFGTLAGFGILLWFGWNLLIFGDPLYFAYGEFSAHAQQAQIEAAGELYTKGELWLSIKTYLYALFYNTYTVIAIFGAIGAIALWFNKKIEKDVRISTIVLIAPFIFNILALYLGHSVLFVQGIVGETWFNVRYGIMLMPSIAIFIGFLVDKYKDLRILVVALFVLVSFFAFVNRDMVTLDDALIGASGKNVAEVSGWLSENTADKEGFVLISAASHDAIIFSSGMPMKKFIHEGTGVYWRTAIETPDRWARWIVMRTHDENDMTWREVNDAPGFDRYELVDSYPFADIYKLRDEYVGQLNTEPVLDQDD